MRYWSLILVLIWLSAEVPALGAQNQELDPIQQAQIEKLIDQLGSAHYAERMKARIELEAIGLPALEALQKAVKSNDQEVSQTARKLVEKLEQQVNTAKLLAPKMVHLKLNNVSVLEALEELTKQTGYTIQVDGSRDNLAKRKITLDTGKTTFWQAFDALCEGAGLEYVEENGGKSTGKSRRFGSFGNGGFPNGGFGGAPLPAKVKIRRGGFKKAQKPAAPNKDNKKIQRFQKAVPGAAGGALQIQIKAAPAQFPAQPLPAVGRIEDLGGGRQGTPSYNFGSITVRDGKPAKLPTSYCGAVRIQILSVKTNGEHIDVVLRATAEPAYQNFTITGTSTIDKAIDERGQLLDLVMKTNPLTPNYINRNGINFYYSNQVRKRQTVVTVQLKKAALPSKVLKVLEGKLATEMLMPAEPMIVVKNVMKAQGKLFKGKDGSSLQIVNINRNANNRILVEVRLQSTAGVNNGFGGIAVGAAGGGGRVIINGNVFINGRRLNNNNQQNLDLLDSKGRPFRFLGTQRRGIQIAGGNQVTQILTLMYQANPGQTDPDQMILAGRRLETITIPFSFEDVPVQ